MGDAQMTPERARELLDGATAGRRVQFHGSYCKEAEGTPFTEWDTSHEMSVVRPDGSRYRLAHYKHAADAYLSQMAPDLARAYLAEHEARVAAEAAQALMAERAATFVNGYALVSRARISPLSEYSDPPLTKEAAEKIAADNARYKHEADGYELMALAIRRLAPEAGVAELAKLRGERDLLRADRDSAARMWQAAEQEKEAAVARSREASQMLAIETHHAAQAEAEAATLRARLAEAEGKVAALTEALEACVSSLERADTEEGVCCCGDNMGGHSDPMLCGHTPVDMGDYYAGKALESARAALAAVKEAEHG